MSRTRLFVSYSSQDREWLNRLRTHLALLERQQLVDVWADTRIEVGAAWEKEIEDALTAARVAVLLVSPAFLASQYVWAKEMPRIVAHQEAGMEVLPLIVRPCAWRLEKELERLQARPGGRALSGGTDHQIDEDLAAFTYELAAKLGRAPAEKAVEAMAARLSQRVQPHPEPAAIAWIGEYPATEVRFRLSYESSPAGDLLGTIEYLGDDTITRVEGQSAPDPQTLVSDPQWPDRPAGPVRLALRFREAAVIAKGRRTIPLTGEYRALCSDREMTGIYVSGGKVLGRFTMQREIYARSARAGA